MKVIILPKSLELKLDQIEFIWRLKKLMFNHGTNELYLKKTN